MLRTGKYERRTQLIGALIVVALHVWLALLVQRMRAREPTQQLDRSLTLVIVEDPVREEPRPPIPEPQRRETPTQSSAATPSPSAPAPALPTSPRGPIDWRANAARSAQLAVEGSTVAPHRSFGPRKEPEPEEPAPPSVFRNTEPRHKLGEVGDDAAGDPVVWINDSCYMTLDKRVQTARDWAKAGSGQFAPAELQCLQWQFGPKQEPDGTLFEHIKKREEPAPPKPGTEMNSLPAQIEAGGVFER